MKEIEVNSGCLCVFQQTNGTLDEDAQKKSPLLIQLTKRRAEKLDYLGVSYGLTSGLLK